MHHPFRFLLFISRFWCQICLSVFSLLLSIEGVLFVSIFNNLISPIQTQHIQSHYFAVNTLNKAKRSANQSNLKLIADNYEDVNLNAKYADARSIWSVCKLLFSQWIMLIEMSKYTRSEQLMFLNTFAFVEVCNFYDNMDFNNAIAYYWALF